MYTYTNLRAMRENGVSFLKGKQLGKLESFRM